LAKKINQGSAEGDFNSKVSALDWNIKEPDGCIIFLKEPGLKIEDAHLLLKSFTVLFSLRNYNKPNQAISFDNL
jgi:hypothetical protein